MTDGSSNFESSSSPRSPDWEALARHLTGESLPEESARIEAALGAQPEERAALARLGTAIDDLRSDTFAGLDVDAALARVKARPEFSDSGIIPIDLGRSNSRSSRPRWLIPMPALAAAALVTVGVASWMSYRNRPREAVATAPSSRMLATGVGVRDSLTLSDGTRIVLGPLSSVKVAAAYGSTSREVEVRGDAWFDIVHDSGKPFTVHAANATIVDVGTKFAVRSDDPEGVSVSVSEGSVSLRQVNTPLEKGVILKAGDNGLLKSGGDVVARRGSASEDDVAWMRGRLVFRGAPLGEVANSMRKWYGIELNVSDPSLANHHLTATFAGESPERVLDVIRLALGAEIERHGDTVIVRSAKGSMRSR
jgi:transmembrane sensor